MLYHLESPQLDYSVDYSMLSVIKIKNLKEAGIYSDGNSLYLKVTKTGTKSWLFRYTNSNGKRTYKGLGSINNVSLAEARSIAADYRIMLANGESITEEKQDNKTFRVLASEFIKIKSPEWKNKKHANQWVNTLEAYAMPHIGELEVPDIDTKTVLKVLKPIWLEKPETASRVRSRIENIIDYAIALGESDKANPASIKVISKVLPAQRKIMKVKHHAALPYADMPTFWIKLSQRSSSSANCLRWLILTASRTNEATCAAKSELSDDIWTIPADRTKSGRDHRVPLSRQAIELIDSLPVESSSDWLFIGRDKNKHISNNTMLKLLKTDMGHRGLTVHGFRSSFRDWVEEQTDFDSRLAESALAHVLRDKTEAAYQRGDLLEKRRVLMQEWADYVCGTPNQKNGIISI